MFGESMAHNIISKANARLKILNRKNEYLSLNVGRLKCYALTQSRFDYGCSACYSNISKKILKIKLHRINTSISVYRLIK